MKLLLFLLFMSPLALAKKHSYQDQRLCPDGYHYVGDDTPPSPKSLGYEEIARSPMYSCYKIVDDASNYVEASKVCSDDEATLASYETVEEMTRVIEGLSLHKYKVKEDDEDKHHGNDKPGHGDKPEYAKAVEFGTSGMFFEDAEKWYWMGSGDAIDSRYAPEVPQEPIPEPMEPAPAQNCLNLYVKHYNEDLPLPSNTYKLVKGQCFDKSPFVCEARVQTVTYATWFRANWVDMLLGFLLVILFIALCVSVCAYSSGGSSTSERRARRNQEQRRQADLPNVIDHPPTYDAAIRIHRPEEASMDTKPTQNSSSGGRMDYYRNRGRELIGKVYYYRSNRN